MNENLEIKKDNTNKGLLFSIVGVLTLVVAIAGATYAFFSATANNAGTIEGTAATADLALDVVQEAGGTGKLIPQLGTAINSAAAANCTDTNTNTVCQIYSLKVTNSSTATVSLSGTILFSGITNMANLKFSTSATETSGYSTTGTAAATTATTMPNSTFSLAPNGTKTIYLIVWIEETGSAQSDSGTFNATVTFNSSDGKGITSTITS